MKGRRLNKRKSEFPSSIPLSFFFEFFFQILNNGSHVTEYKLCKISRTISSTKISLSLGIPPSFSKRFKVLFSVYDPPFYYSLNRGSQWNIQRHDFAFFRGIQRRATNTLCTLEQLKNARLTTISVALCRAITDSSKTRDRYICLTSIMTERRESKPFFSSSSSSFLNRSKAPISLSRHRDDFVECNRKKTLNGRIQT